MARPWQLANLANIVKGISYVIVKVDTHSRIMEVSWSNDTFIRLTNMGHLCLTNLQFSSTNDKNVYFLLFYLHVLSGIFEALRIKIKIFFTNFY